MLKFKKGCRYWCWWYSRYLYFVDLHYYGGAWKYKFEDVAGVPFTFGGDNAKNLVEK